MTAPPATSVSMHGPSPSALNQRGLTALSGCPKQSPLCPADPQGCVTACGPGETAHKASPWLSKAFPSDLMKNTARNSHCLSFISFSRYGLSWGCRRLFANELKIPCVGSALYLAAYLPGWEMAQLVASGPHSLGARF